MPAADRPSLAEQVFGKERAEELRRHARIAANPAQYFRENGVSPTQPEPFDGSPKPRTSSADAVWLANLIRFHGDVLKPALLEALADDIGRIVADLVTDLTRREAQ